MITNSRKIRYCQFSLFMDSIFTNSPTGWNLSVTPQINALVALLKSFRDMHRVAKFWIPKVHIPSWGQAKQCLLVSALMLLKKKKKCRFCGLFTATFLLVILLFKMTLKAVLKCWLVFPSARRLDVPYRESTCVGILSKLSLNGNT